MDVVRDTFVSKPDEKSPILHPQTFTVYRKRWIILILYCIYSMFSAIHWMQYSIIANIVAKFYSVSFEAVAGTAMINSLMFIIFAIPGSYILDKMGLRTSILIGILACCIGSWTKVIAVNPNRFWLVLLSQCITGVSQIIAMPIPPKLAAVWFGANEVSFACTLGVIGTQMSGAIGLIVPSLFVKPGDLKTMQTGFNHMAYGIAIFTTIAAVVLFVFFDDAPPTVPSVAQLKVQENKKKSFDYKKTLKSLLKNKSFVFLLIVFGLYGGVAVAIAVLLNQLILAYYSDAYQDVGLLGFSINMCGTIGLLLYGFLLSKFGRLKLFTLFAYIASTIATFLFLFLLGQGLLVVFILGIILSICWCITLCAGFQVGAEITFPEPEAASSGILINFSQLCAIIITYVDLIIRDNLGEFAGNITLVIILLFANVFLFLIKFDLKRSEVDPPERASKCNRVALL